VVGATVEDEAAIAAVTVVAAAEAEAGEVAGKTCTRLPGPMTLQLRLPFVRATRPAPRRSFQMVALLTDAARGSVMVHVDASELRM
jgi:hypothetical protein